MRIGVDVDDVLYPWREQSPQWDDIIGPVLKVALYEDAPYEGVCEPLSRLQAAGHTVHLVTARSHEGGRHGAHIRELTERWLQRHRVPHDSLHFTRDKPSVPTDVFLDDDLTNYARLDRAGVAVFLLDRPLEPVAGRRSARGFRCRVRRSDRGLAVYVTCSCGQRHWGHLGAAGLLLTDPERTGVVLQLRSRNVHQGGTWGVPGGALEPGETPTDAALREAGEEAGIDPAAVVVVTTVVGTVHPDWTYTYVIAETPRSDRAWSSGASWEADRTTWVDLADVTARALHPGLRGDWPRLRTVMHETARPGRRGGGDERGGPTGGPAATGSPPDTYIVSSGLRGLDERDQRPA